MDRIVWINHAGFELQTQGLRIVSDPWIEGLAFKDSWALVSPSKYTYEDFAGVDYIWFSHEHPDHFSPSNMRKIPEEIRKTITVLFQKTQDGRLARYCQGLGFKVREAADWERMDLGNGVFFTIKTIYDDSLCFIETPERYYLNINDCVAPDTGKFHNEIAARFKKVDVLLTQFSFASWAGNPGDMKNIRAAGEEKIVSIETQLDIYRPKIWIPFASYIWFCRPDNFHLNVGANKIGDIFDHFMNENSSGHYRCPAVIMYPGDVYEIGKPHDSALAIARYKDDERDRAAIPMQLDRPPISPAELEKLSNAQQEKLRTKNSMWTLLPLKWLGYLRPIRILLTDLDRRLSFSMFTGIRWLEQDAPVDIEFASDMFAQMLAYGTGYDTLYISGRFKENTPRSNFLLSRNFAVFSRNEHGDYFPQMLFRWSYVRSKFGGGWGAARASEQP